MTPPPPTVLNHREFLHENFLDRKFGPPPINIFKTLRVGRELSLQAIATSTGLSKNAVVRCEAGTYLNPLGSLVDFWVKRGYSYPELLADYEEFQLSMRDRAHLYFGPHLFVKTEPPQHPINQSELVILNVQHPLRQLRYTRPSRHDNRPLPVGIEQVSRDLCLPVDTLRYFEKKWRRQQSVPKGLLAVLNSIGYSGLQVASFDDAYKLWRHNSLRIAASDPL